jgi:uncharacterized protein YceH (UPF0502 family)
MNPPLTAVEVRILGALVEKETTTPDTYPLTLSGLTAACNQSTNREPVMRLEEGAIMEAIVSLRRRSLLRAIQPAGSRVTKYQHLLTDALNVDQRELALLGVTMLRGAQTLAELHVRTARLAEFADAADVESVLERLITREPEPLAVRLARRPGQKELRYTHLLSGDAAFAEEQERVVAPSSTPSSTAGDERITALERTVEALQAELQALRTQFSAFEAQFR